MAESSSLSTEQFKGATDLMVEASAAAQAGDAAGAQAKLDEAEAALQAFVAENPEEAGAFFNRGLRNVLSKAGVFFE